jgi:hypothetical protein
MSSRSCLLKLQVSIAAQSQILLNLDIAPSALSAPSAPTSPTSRTAPTAPKQLSP